MIFKRIVAIDELITNKPYRKIMESSNDFILYDISDKRTYFSSLLIKINTNVSSTADLMSVEYIFLVGSGLSNLLYNKHYISSKAYLL